MDLLRKLAVEQEAAIIAVTHDEKISPDLVDKFRNQSQRASVNTPEEMKLQIQKVSALYGRLAKDLNIRAD